MVTSIPYDVSNPTIRLLQNNMGSVYKSFLSKIPLPPHTRLFLTIMFGAVAVISLKKEAPVLHVPLFTQ